MGKPTIRELLDEMRISGPIELRLAERVERVLAIKPAVQGDQVEEGYNLALEHVRRALNGEA